MATAAIMAHANAPHAPIEVAFPLPKAPHTNVHLQLTDTGTNLLLFLTTCTPDAPSLTTMGSFVFAMKNHISPTDTLSTPLFTNNGTLDFATRLSKLLAHRTGKPVYVANSMSFASAGLGGTVEEELEGFRRIVDVVVDLLETKSRAVSTA